MSFIKKLPAAYKSLLVQRKNAQNELMALQQELGEDEYGYHDCDCEYCPVPEAPDLTPNERVEKEAESDKLEETISEYDSTIRSVEGYAKLVKVELPKDEK